MKEKQPYVPVVGPVPEATKMHVRYWLFRQASRDYIAGVIYGHPDLIAIDAHCNQWYPFPEEMK